MPAKKTPAQLQRDIDEALARRHGQARERWLSLQAGPHHRERQAAYGEMAAASRAIEDARRAKRSHSTKLEEATAGFAIHTDHEDVIKDNARDRFGSYGDAAERTKAMKAGLVDVRGEITDKGWKQLNEDIQTLENNAMAWLRKTFVRAGDQGHSDEDLIGSVTFNPRSIKQARNIYYAAREGGQERIDFTDTGHGDFAGSGGAWKGVSHFGQDVLGGSITFFDVQPPEAIEIAEETVDRAARRSRRA